MSKTKTILGFIAGAAAGALAGILLAPASGADTRKSLFKIGKEAGDETGQNEVGADDHESPSSQAGEEKIRSVMHQAKENQTGMA